MLRKGRCQGKKRITQKERRGEETLLPGRLEWNGDGQDSSIW